METILSHIESQMIYTINSNSREEATRWWELYLSVYTEYKDNKEERLVSIPLDQPHPVEY